MFFFLILFCLSFAYYKEKYQLVLSTEEISYLVSSGVVTFDKSEEIWEVLVKHAENTHSDRLSDTGFTKSSEILLFGVFPIISIVMTLGGFVMVLVMLWIINYAYESANKWQILVANGGCAFISMSVGYSLYEFFGTVLISCVLMAYGLNSLYEFLQEIMVFANFCEPKKNFLDFSKAEGVIFAVIGLVSYYYSLFIAFPLVQVPFFLGILYFIKFFWVKTNKNTEEKRNYYI